ncbi:eukaryotic aspartyl protease family protein [Striga asiatica]|uniref:Eukaryotic aspartyl protease family protein n=1 Tax=Striga asiatica TaxID=4170 RepID=A0A5A7NWA7_STRAF|nr:eukaryotic aspartyl protease family protein [Striga asiatica]
MKRQKGYKSLPSMTLHFKNANLVVRREELFLVMDKISSNKGEYFCLAIIPSDFISVLGSHQQTNQRFIYDTKEKHLLFSTDNCSKDGKNTVGNSNGLAMRLIHPNSPESPFYQSKLHPEERIKMLASQSTHAQINVQLFQYIVKIGIGTFKTKPPYKEYYLEMDTGSSLIWLQCNGCTKCFKQTPAPFPKENSSSFRPVIENNNYIFYKSNYHDGDTTQGILARETFHLKTNKGGLAKIENVQFGCGLNNKMQYGDFSKNKIAGAMGLGWEDISFVKQLGNISKGKFSYCLPVVISGKEAPNSYLRFGDAIIAHNKSSKTTPLYKRGKPSHYHVEIQGISINRTSLNIHPGVFAFKNDSRRSGSIIDTGTPYSRIVAPAFEILKLELEKYFSRSKSNLKKIKGNLGLELCFERSKREGFKNLPDITLHLQGSQADFVLRPEAGFEVVNQLRLLKSREYFCLAMIRDEERSVIGSHQLTNHRITHDTKNNELLFYPEDYSNITFTTIVLAPLNITLVSSNGLTIELIHPYSPESPFFQPNLSHEKRIKLSTTQSNTHPNYFSNMLSSTIQADLEVQLLQYTVKIGIGTFNSKPPYKEYYLLMDTGSSLVWLQCEGCTKCFKQIPKPFPKGNSSSFRPITYKSKQTFYECEYTDGDSTRGILAHETFYLKTKTSELAKIENIKFGCGLENNILYGKLKDNKIVGIMGLGWDDNSFVKQLGPKSKGKFSYCLPRINLGKAPNTYLRFGDEALVQIKLTKSTQLLRIKNKDLYYVEMLGISINRAKLNISPQVFAVKNSNSRTGCIFDSGTIYSRIVSPAFEILKQGLEKHFLQSKGLKRIKRDLGLELCYERTKPEGFRNLPEITFHLKGSQADFVLKPEAAFEIFIRSSMFFETREFFCLAMLRDRERSTIGAHQQTNQAITYDMEKKKLLFYPEDCSKNV